MPRQRDEIEGSHACLRSTLVEAVNLALARAMAEDPDVVVLGEDVGVNGGVFRATAGLQQRFGAERVLDTPLAEAADQRRCASAWRRRACGRSARSSSWGSSIPASISW